MAGTISLPAAEQVDPVQIERVELTKVDDNGRGWKALLGPRNRRTPSLNRGPRELWRPTASDGAGHEWAGSSNAVGRFLPLVEPTEWRVPGTLNGVDSHNKRVVTFDPLTALAAGWVANPNSLTIASPGSGKSGKLKLQVVDAAARGRNVFILGDSKDEYRELVEALGGEVTNIGPGRALVDPLTLGTAPDAQHRLEQAGNNEAARQIIDYARAQRQQLVSALLHLASPDPLTVTQTSILLVALKEVDRLAHQQKSQVTMELLVEVLKTPSQAMMDELLYEDVDAFKSDARPLYQTILVLLAGPVGSVLGPCPAQKAPKKQVLRSWSTRHVPTEAAKVAAMLVIWAETFTNIESNAALADAGLAKPANNVAVLDELWRVLDGWPPLVQAVNSLTRLNRSMSTALLMALHSAADLERHSAAELIDRCSTIWVGGTRDHELDLLERHLPGNLSVEERRWLTLQSRPGRFLLASDLFRSKCQIRIPKPLLPFVETTKLAKEV